MTVNKDQSVQELISVFTRFDKLDWDRKTIEGYKPSEIRVLTCIKQNTQYMSEIKVSEISRQLNVTTPSVTPILNKLEQHALITRRIDENDRRVILITLTNEGRSIANSALTHLNQTFTQLEEYIGLDDSKELTRLLTKVYEFFHENQE